MKRSDRGHVRSTRRRHTRPCFRVMLMYMFPRTLTMLQCVGLHEGGRRRGRRGRRNKSIIKTSKNAKYHPIWMPPSCARWADPPPRPPSVCVCVCVCVSVNTHISNDNKREEEVPRGSSCWFWSSHLVRPGSRNVATLSATIGPR